MEKQDYEISPDELADSLDQYILVDVRGASEQEGPSGCIHCAKLVTLGEDLKKFLDSADPN